MLLKDKKFFRNSSLTMAFKANYFYKTNNNPTKKQNTLSIFSKKQIVFWFFKLLYNALYIKIR